MKEHTHRLITLIVAGMTLATPALLEAKEYTLSPTDDWFGVLHGNALQPGDTVTLSAGVYSDKRLLEMRHRGTKQKPIIIQAKEGAHVILKRPDARQNSINMAGVQYLTLSGVEITGGSSGIRIYKHTDHMAKFITLEDLHIHHIGGVGVTCNHADNTYEGMHFKRNHIHHTKGHGEAFYLGANNNKDGSTSGYIFNSIIENNYIHDLNGPDISQGDGIEVKDGSYNNIIRDNVIHDTRYPGIIVYGTDGKQPNIIEGNVIWRTSDHGIQAAADAVIRNNLIFDYDGQGIHCRSHQSAKPGNLTITFNTVIANGKGLDCFNLTLPATGRYSGPIVIANNALFSPKGRVMRFIGFKGPTIIGNRGNGSIHGPKLPAEAWATLGPRERHLSPHGYPLPGSGLIGKANPAYRVRADFNGQTRQRPMDVGAYIFNPRGNPGWKCQKGFKELNSGTSPQQ